MDFQPGFQSRRKSIPPSGCMLRRIWRCPDYLICGTHNLFTVNLKTHCHVIVFQLTWVQRQPFCSEITLLFRIWADFCSAVYCRHDGLMGIELQTKYHHQQNRYFGPPDGYHFFFFSNLYVILSNIHLIFGGSPLVLLRRYGGIHVYGRLLVPFRLMYGFFVCVCVCFYVDIHNNRKRKYPMF